MVKDKTRRYVLNVHCQDEYADTNGADAYLIEIDAATRDLLLQMRKEVSPLFKLEGFYSAEFFNYLGGPISLPDEEWTESLETDGVIDVPAESEVAYSNFRRDCCVVHIKDDGILWHFYEKHSSISFETEVLLWSEIEKELS